MIVSKVDNAGNVRVARSARVARCNRVQVSGGRRVLYGSLYTSADRSTYCSLQVRTGDFASLSEYGARGKSTGACACCRVGTAVTLQLIAAIDQVAVQNDRGPLAARAEQWL